MRRPLGGLAKLVLPGRVTGNCAFVWKIKKKTFSVPCSINHQCRLAGIVRSNNTADRSTLFVQVAPFIAQGHTIQRANKKRRDAETADADPEMSAAADSNAETQASSAQIAGFSTAVAAVQYLVLFQGGGRILLSNGEEFGASRLISCENWRP
jgi:hypothetical protein